MSAPVRMRDAGIEELPEVQRIENACFQEDRYSVEVLAAMLEEEGFETFLAEEGEVMGSATVNYRPELVAAQLVSLAVLPQFRGRGVAKALLAEAEARVGRRGADRMVLQVSVTNVAGLNLYLHQGYVLDGMIGDYYGPGRDAYFMDKVLDPTAR
ncbi:MAG: GNAT family N-acetyltransferase [Methanomassiliicoccus sp.]|nr:GNAT family N-acetyltransferase [Methanomassiliicoccus sp.]